MPRIATRADQETSITLEHKRAEYRMTIKSVTDADAKSSHSIRMRITETDDSGNKTTIYAPRVSLPAGSEATIEVGGDEFHVKATAGTK